MPLQSALGPCLIGNKLFPMMPRAGENGGIPADPLLRQSRIDSEEVRL
jgi:hypothetical protein